MASSYNMQAKMKTTIVNESFIKPSSATPTHLKTYKVSLLDQVLAFDPDNAGILYYSSQPRPAASPTSQKLISKRSQLLKESLSETLTRYYPLAGRIKGSFSIDCNDQGVRYVEARAHISLSTYYRMDYVKLMNSSLPGDVNSREPPSPGSYVAMIQETTFSCGSIAIGFLIRHMVADGAGVVTFLNAWAAACTCNRTSMEKFSPKFDGPVLYPQYHAFTKEVSWKGFDAPFEKTGKRCARRFLFDASSVARLQAQATSVTVKRPTRSEAVSSFLCKCISDIHKARSGIDRPTAFSSLVNLRPRGNPPLPLTSFGNFLWMAPGLYLAGETKLSNIVCKMRKATSKLDADFMNIIKNQGYFALRELVKETTRVLTSSTFPNGVNYVFFDSLCNMGLYEIDFGWGKPIWVTIDDPPPNSTTKFVDTVFLSDWNIRKAVEAWVYMDEEDLLSLEKYDKLLEYASTNPNPFTPNLLMSQL